MFKIGEAVSFLRQTCTKFTSGTHEKDDEDRVAWTHNWLLGR